MYQTKAPLDVKRDEVHKVVHPHALPLYCRKFGIRYSFELSSWMYVLIVDDLPLSDSVVNELLDIRRDVPFSLRAILRVKIRPAEYQKSSGRYQIIEPEPTKSVYDMLPPLSASVVEFERKKTEVPKFDLDEVLANPELDAIKPTHIDPASMLADDIESLTKEGKEFVNNPTWSGLASMAVIAIPGKVAEFGSSVTKDYKQTFFKQYPDLEGKVIVHHAVEQQVQRRYPGLVSDSELHSLENLRGIPKEKNNDLHLSKIRKEWNRFYKTNPNPSKEDLLKKATEIDLKLGGEFKPPIGD